MKPPAFLKKCRESYSAKIFAIFALLTISISFAFTALFFLHQKKTLTDSMVHEGELLVRLFAHNSRLGIFAENAGMLSDPAAGILEHREVEAVMVFSADGRPLLEKRRPERGHAGFQEESKGGGFPETLEMLKKSSGPVYLQRKTGFEFWAPVTLGVRPSAEDAVFLGESLPQQRDRIIGFVQVVVGKGGLDKKLQALLLKSILLGAIFLVVGSTAAYFLAMGITKHLKRLTAGVKALGSGASLKKIPVETSDEIGRLADAFNTMTENLLTREAEKEELEEQLRHSQKMEAIGTLAGGVAHDFNNILTAVIGYGTFLQEELPEDSPLREYADQIIAASDRAVTLTRRLLAFSRKQLIDVRPANLNDLIRSLGNILARLIHEDIDLKLSLTEQETTILADPGLIDQLMINLCTNARDAMPEGGRLTIETAIVELEGNVFQDGSVGKPGKYALLTVTDTGVGMDDNVRERIFDPFFTTKEVGKGTGLGLSMVYGIVKQHEGFLMLESAPGQGSTFRIYLPTAEPHPPENRAESVAPPRGGDETILVAEDDWVVRGLVREILEKHGCRVIEAVDGDDAIRKFSEHVHAIDMVLLDVIMPKKNGKEVFEEMKKIKPDVKTLFTSGYTHDVISRKGIVEEGLNFIAKPVQPEELLRKIHEVLHGHDAP